MNLSDLGSTTSLHLVMDTALPDGSMPSAAMRIHGPTVLVYAAMANAIAMFARRNNVAASDVHYNATWKDAE